MFNSTSKSDAISQRYEDSAGGVGWPHFSVADADLEHFKGLMSTGPHTDQGHIDLNFPPIFSTWYYIRELSETLGTRYL